MSFSAQGSITVKRVRSGDTLFITFKNNGNPLYQAINPDNEEVSPDWSVADNQPTLTPQVTSARGETVTLTNHAWKYNDVSLVFSGEEDGEYIIDSTGYFAMKTSDGTLKIIGNLASATNNANDTLEYSCTATMSGLEYSLSKSVDIIIQSVGASSYGGTIVATTEQLTETESETTITAQLKLAGEDVSSYVKWYKNDLETEWSDKAGVNPLTVSRDDVDGTTLFIAELYANETDTTPVYRVAIRIIDTADEYQIVYSKDGDVEDSSSSVTVTGKLYNMRTNAEVTPSNASWVTYVMNPSTWEYTTGHPEPVESNQVTITTADTDESDGTVHDVEVTGEVSWEDEVTE